MNTTKPSAFAKQVKADLDHLTSDSKGDAETKERLDKATLILREAIAGWRLSG